MADASWTIISRHLGSMAFGSLVMAICQLIRLLLNAIDDATKDAQDKSLLLKLAIKCARCAAWCLQKTIEFVAHYSYVFVAIDGTTFCRGCRDTFQLVALYPAQTAINQAVKKLLVLIISCSIPAICAICVFAILDNDESYRAEYAPLYPALTVFACAYLLSIGITTVIEGLIDTIYLCAFKDMEANKTFGPKFMSNNLREAFGIDTAVDEAGSAAAYYKPVEGRRHGQKPDVGVGIGLDLARGL
mmetsp:Transcript_19534/g.44905  ORF Transcript_19534/g.44905 Transcript_19534/m.44905 type:complete len:245 (-) Transcript_19534:715-1449(-)